MKTLQTFLLLCLMIHQLSAQQLQAFAGPDTLICIEGSSDSVDVEFGAINTAIGGVPPYQYRWFTDHSNGHITSDFIYDSTAQDPTLLFVELDGFPRTFYVEVTDDSGTSAMDSMIVNVCGNLPVPLGCSGIYATVGDTITLEMVTGYTCIDSIEWFPKDHIISSDTGTSIQVLVSDENFNYNGYYATIKGDDCTTQSSHTCPVVADVFPLGYESNTTSTSRVFPNPSSGTFSIVSNTFLTRATLVNQIGQEVMSLPVLGKNAEWSIQVPSGIYLLQLTSEYGIQYERIVID